MIILYSLNNLQPFLSRSLLNKTHIFSALFTCCLVLSPQTKAELEEDSMFLILSGDEELISIATVTPRPVSKAPAVASVINTITKTDVREQVDDYNWVNLSINGRNIWHGISLQFAIKNLFDSDAQEPGPSSIPNNYPLEGSSAYIGLSGSL